MTKEEFLIATAAVLCTLREMDGHAPKSIIQMALGEKYKPMYDLEVFLAFCGILEKSDLIKVSASVLTLTPNGLEKATRLEAVNGKV